MPLLMRLLADCIMLQKAKNSTTYGTIFDPFSFEQAASVANHKIPEYHLISAKGDTLIIQI